MQNELLFGMDQQDLNQRYKDSYVRYNDKVMFCNGFADGNIFFIHPDHGDPIQELFDWTKLDVARPPSRWYLTPLYGLIHFKPLIKRQYTRGLTQRNTHLFSPHHGRPSINRCMDAILDPMNWDLGWRTPASIKKILAKKDTLLSPLMAKVLDTIYYRDNPVATIKDDNIVLSNPLFEPELREVIIGATFVKAQMVLLRKPKKPSGLKRAVAMDWAHDNIAEALLAPRFNPNVAQQRVRADPGAVERLLRDREAREQERGF